MAVPSEKVKARTYYHGTDSAQTAEKIIADQCLKAPEVVNLDARYGQSFQRPQAGRIYLTPSLRYAVIYALGGSYAGQQMPEWYFQKPGRTQYGYLFTVPGSSLEDIEPDEDQVGDIPNIARNALAGSPVSDYNDHPEIQTTLATDPDHARRISHNVGRHFTPTMDKKSREGISAWHSKAGKRAVKHMSPSERVQVAELGTSIAAQQACIPFTQVWRIDKRRSAELKRDCSNFYEVAERVA